MWNPTARAQHSRAGLRYGSDLTDVEWQVIEGVYAQASLSRPASALGMARDICRDRGSFDRTLSVTKAAPPTFVVQAWDDATDPICNSLMYAAALDKAGVSTEVHLFAKGGHAFALRRGGEPVGTWPHLVEMWLRQIAML